MSLIEREGIVRLEGKVSSELQSTIGTEGDLDGNVPKLECHQILMANLINDFEIEPIMLDEKDPEVFTMFYNDEEVYRKQLEEFLQEELNEVECSECNFKTDDTRKLKRHAKVTHQIKKLSERVDNVCPPCNKEFLSSDNLDNHIREEHLKLSLCCNQCKFDSVKRSKILFLKFDNT